MGRPPCCDKSNVKRGHWTAEEDAKILAYVANHGIGNWTLVPKKAGLNRCGKSCRLRWTNYLRPDLKHDGFTPQEEQLIIHLHKAIGSRWSLIAKQLPGRTDNDVKNYWNTKLRKKLRKMGIDPVTHKPFSQIISEFGNISGINQTEAEPPSTGLSNIIKPDIEQVQDNSFITNDHPSWNFLAKFHQVTKYETLQPHFINEVTSPCSSSSSPAFTQLSSSQSFSCQRPQPSSPFLWSEFLLTDPVMSAEFQQEQDHDFPRMLSTTNSSNNGFANVFDNNQFFDRVGQVSGFGSYMYDAVNGNQAPNNNNHHHHADASSSSATSFVDGILDKDREMSSQFPEFLDPSFD